MTKENSKGLRRLAKEYRAAAASEKADLLSGNYPTKKSVDYFERHIAKLEQKAFELEARADRLARTEKTLPFFRRQKPGEVSKS